jgi:Xaa-Pro aminopeptidase
MKRVLTADRENQVQATIEYTFRNLGACCWAFPSIVAAGENATILHYQSNNDPVVRAGLVLADVGAEVEGYAADVTRTFPANGRFSAEQRLIYDAVLEAQVECLDLMRPGRLFGEVQTRALEVIGRGLLRLGLISRNDPAQTRLYFFHGVGHPLGLQTHDVFDRTRKFEPNMVVTLEPGIYVRKNDVLSSEAYKGLAPPEQDSIRKALERFSGIGIRIEDDVLITDSMPKIMSAAAPRTTAGIEEWMARRE